MASEEDLEEECGAQNNEECHNSTDQMALPWLEQEAEVEHSKRQLQQHGVGNVSERGRQSDLDNWSALQYSKEAVQSSTLVR